MFGPFLQDILELRIQEDEIQSVIFMWCQDKIFQYYVVKTETSQMGQLVKNLISEDGM